MPDRRLKDSLADLHRELTAAPSVDDETRKLLEQVASDIRELTTAERPPPELDTLTERIGAQAVELQQEHPAIGGALRRLIDALAAMGI